MKKFISFLCLGGLLLMGCASHRHNPRGEQLTAGTVQKEIHEGLSATEVAKRLGSPNIVKGNSESGETWIYDRISSQVTTRSSSVYGTLLVIGAGKRSASSTQSEQTLTVVIEFNQDDKVEDFSYHRSKF